MENPLLGRDAQPQQGTLPETRRCKGHEEQGYSQAGTAKPWERAALGAGPKLQPCFLQWPFPAPPKLTHCRVQISQPPRKDPHRQTQWFADGALLNRRKPGWPALALVLLEEALAGHLSREPLCPRGSPGTRRRGPDLLRGAEELNTKLCSLVGSHREVQSTTASLVRTHVVGSASVWREQAHGPCNAIPACCSPRHEGCWAKTLFARGLWELKGRKGAAAQRQTPGTFGDPYLRQSSPPQQWAFPSTFSRRRVAAPRKAHWVVGKGCYRSKDKSLPSRPRPSHLSPLPVALAAMVPFKPTAPSVPAVLGAAERHLASGTDPCHSHGVTKERMLSTSSPVALGFASPTYSWVTSPQLAQVWPEAGPHSPFQR